MCKAKNYPIYEPQLDTTFEQVVDKNVQFTTDIKDALEGTDVVIIALPTPTKTFGEGKDCAYDLSYTEIGIRNIIEFYNKNPMKDKVILVEKSTVPIGTAKVIESLIDSCSIP